MLAFNSRKGQTLQVSIHRALAQRLIAAALIMATLAGFSAFFYERGRISDTVLANALGDAQLLAQRLAELMAAGTPIDDDTIQAELRDIATNRPERQDGRFVLVRVYDTQGSRAGGLADETYSLLESLRTWLAQHYRQTNQTTAAHRQLFRIGDHHFIYLALPLRTNSGPLLGYADGIFALSSQSQAEITRRVQRAVLAVIGVVLATTALIYPLILTLTRRVTALSSKLLDANLHMLQVLGSAIAKRDHDTDIHNFRVTIFAVRLAEALGLPKKRIQALIKGAFLHDVGKIAISDNILLKQDRLTEDEFCLMKTHVSHGLDIVRRSPWLADAEDVVYFHHEKFDGNGYLNGLKGTEIPLEARIFCLSDVFDALTSERPYKPPLSYEKAIQILEAGRGTHFDPRLLDTFVEIAPDLYREYSNRQDEHPRQELQKIIDHYFSGDIRHLQSARVALETSD